jgi:Divergent InlB B-repeat domain
MTEVVFAILSMHRSIFQKVWGNKTMKKVINRTSKESVIKNLKPNPIMFLVKQFLLCLCFSMMLAQVCLSLAQADVLASWTDSPSNPLFGGLNPGDDRAYYPSALKVGSTYHIWYGDGSATRHASSTHPDFSDVNFQPPNQPSVVTGLVAGVTYHPRVLYNAAGWNIGGNFYAGPFLMYYVGANTSYFDGPPRVAHSANGTSWTDIGPCAISNSSQTYFYIFDVLYEGGTTWKAYATDGSVHYFTSTDGINWTGTAFNILGSPLQSWETSSFTPPHVIKSGGQYIMFYGSGSGGDAAIGVASSPDGQNFTKSIYNPIFSVSDGFSWRNSRTYIPYVIQDGMSWLMYYCGRSSNGVYSIGYALPTTHTLTYNAGPNGSISGTTPQTVNHGASGTAVTAVANTGYHFVQWSDLSTANPRTDTNVTANITVTASFAINTTQTSNLPNGITLTANSLTGCTDVTTTVSSSPNGYTLINIYDITCTSTTGQITVTIPYNPSAVPAGREGTLRMFHWNGSSWDAVSTSVDTTGHTVTGQVTSLSPFGIGYYSGGYSTGANENMIALLAILAISTGVFFIRKRRVQKI